MAHCLETARSKSDDEMRSGLKYAAGLKNRDRKEKRFIHVSRLLTIRLAHEQHTVCERVQLFVKCSLCVCASVSPSGPGSVGSVRSSSSEAQSNKIMLQ